MNLATRLSKSERDELEALMETRDPSFAGPMQGSITRVHGFLTSVVSGPIIVPSEWIPVVFGDHSDGGWESIKQARRAMTLIMRFYNEISSHLGRGGRQYSILIDRLGDRPDTLDLADDWCRGYLLGVAMREGEWKEAMEAPELSTVFLPILTIASPENTGFDPINQSEEYKKMLDVLPRCAIEIYEWWRKKFVASMPAMSGQMHAGTVRRTAPKISPNASCPCGSGKKYKRCCSASSVL